MWQRIRAWWNTVIDPPRDRPGYFLIYLIIAFLPGLATMLDGPKTVAIVLGPELSLVWSTLCMAGGVLGATMTLSTWWAMERAAIFLVLSGLSLYLLSTLGAQIMLGGSRWGQLGMILGMGVVFVKRFWHIRRWTWAPPGQDR